MGATEISSLYTYDHLTRRIAIDPDSIRFCDFHNSMIDFSSDDLIFFFNTQIPFICRNEQFAQFKKNFLHRYMVEKQKFSNINVSIRRPNVKKSSYI